MNDRCQSCGQEQDTGIFAYLVCGECWHVYDTEEDLLRVWRELWIRLDFPEAARADLMAVTAEEIFACPCCAHDL